MNTQYSWKNPVEVSTPGEKQGTVVVTYPDGSKDELPVQVKVGTDADLYTPKGQQVVTEVCKTPDAKSGVSNSQELPVDTQYSWKSPVDVTTPGKKQGTVEVTYPDGTKDELPVQVKVGTDADLYTPKGQQVNTELDKKPEAKSGVANSTDLPTDTQYSWKSPVEVSTPGEKQGTVEVTYPDGSKDELPVQVKVGTDADLYIPKGQQVKTEVGKTPVAKNGVSNSQDFPADTKYSWKNSVDVTTPGEKQGTVEVTYPDGSKDELPVKVTVLAPDSDKKPVKMVTDAEKYIPQGQAVTTELGKTPAAKSGVKNSAKLPVDTQYSWKNPVEVSTPGEKQGTVVVTYPDGSQDELPVQVKVGTDADLYTPKGQQVVTEVGKTPAAKNGVSNSQDFPADTKYNWKNPVDVTTPGEKQGTVEVTYPDGSKDELPVKVTVLAPDLDKKPVKRVTDAEKYTPQGQTVTTELGKTPAAKSGVKNSSEFPADTKYSWKSPVNVVTPGEKQGTVEVTYPDGSKDELPVQVKVGTDADLYTPKGQPVNTELNKVPEAKSGVANHAELPTDTQYSWKNPVNVTTPGEKQGTAVVTYPDGSQDELPVQVKVGTDADLYTPKGQPVNTELNKEPAAKSGVANSADLPADTKYNWKNPVEVSTPGKKQGMVVVTYPDGSKEELSVPVSVLAPTSDKKHTEGLEKVVLDAEKYTPQSQMVNTDLGKQPEAKAGVLNSTDLPAGTKYSWKTPVNVTTPGDKQGTVEVTYPDGSKEELSVPVTVLAPTPDKGPVKVVTDAEKYTPQSQTVTTELGKAPEAKSGVSNSADLPSDTKYSWKMPVDVATPGDKQSTVEVTYPDGSQDELQVEVKVGTDADLYTPKAQRVRTELNKQPKAKVSVVNSATLPAGTKYNWKTPVDVTTAGNKQGTVVVTYPDGSKDELSVPVSVLAPVSDEENKTATDADKYQPRAQQVTTVLGKLPAAKSGVTNSGALPADTQYSWKMPVDVTNAGNKQGTVVVTYPDGSKDELPVTVVVLSPAKKPVKATTDADKYAPRPQVVTTELGKVPAPQTGVANKDELPAKTDYSWKRPVDVMTVGAKQATVVVTYPDKSQAEVVVTVKVHAKTKTKQVTQQVLAIKDNAKRDHGSVVGTHKHLAKQALPQTGETNAGAYELLGAFLTLLAGVLGLGAFFEKRSQK